MPDAVEALRADPRAALIALDFDGTLAPIVARPSDARLAPGALEVLQQLAAAIGQLAVISGRAADEVVHLGGLDAVAGLCVLGHYGLQSWRDGVLRSPSPDPRVDLVRQRLPSLLADAAAGVYVEDKEHSVAIHTRPAAAPQEALDELAPALRALADSAGLEAVPGRYVLELRPAGIDKGTALRSLVAELGATTVIYVGDDVGDLPAFRAVASLRSADATAGNPAAGNAAAGNVATGNAAAGDAPATGDAGRTSASGVAVAGLAVVAVSGLAEVPAELRAAADLELPGPVGVVAWLAGLAAGLDQS